MRTLSPAEIEREVARILQTQDWPLGSFLPVKNLYESTFGFICATVRGGPEPTVYEGNLFTCNVDSKSLEKLPSRTFETIEEMVRAGWVGD